MIRTTKSLRGLGAVVFAGLILTQPAARAQQAGKLDVSQIPQKVMSAPTGKFPSPKIHKWTRETEGDTVLYDIEFTQEGRKFEADIREDGAIDNWERAIAPQDLPAAVRQAVEERYPGSTLAEIMAITAVKDGKEALEV